MSNLENFIVIGVSHESLTLEERERFIKTKPSHIIEKLFLEEKIKAYVNLSTCLRVEFYLELNENTDILKIKDLFPLKNIYVKSSMEALDYLFKLSCGFYSIIKGEDQILAQIKIAYSEALENKHSSKLINIIFNKAVELGKKFRTESNIAHNALSLEAISLKFVKSKFNDIKDKNIFILGIGDLSQAILKILLKDNLKNIYITNRTYHTAEQIKDKFPSVNLIDYREKYDGLVRADIIISATSASHYVVEYEKFISKMCEEKEYLFLDLAVPRDIDERLAEHKNISIFNLDDIWEAYNNNVCTRDKLLEEHSYLIAEQKEKLIKKIDNSLKYS
ncbi:glutamyl-tRNA reductase [Fusobacterium russii]|uniref:glutamyl-tRNA reductase n=1 Tax=Fusobacterium russii TaxID=854 RepID=UPI0003AAD5D6|nr:glutamyl-tRNA reductase [Fusobacterium russii]